MGKLLYKKERRIVTSAFEDVKSVKGEMKLHA